MISQIKSAREQMEESFSMGEANAFLSGLDPYQHPLYAMLKANVLSGEMTASEMGDATIAYALEKSADKPAR
jgi:hypothetical protein